jgi:hypothetical protein
VTRAKYAISRFRPVQGRVPLRPMPMSRVAARTRVSSSGGGGGILPIVELVPFPVTVIPGSL